MPDLSPPNDPYGLLGSNWPPESESAYTTVSEEVAGHSDGHASAAEETQRAAAAVRAEWEGQSGTKFATELDMDSAKFAEHATSCTYMSGQLAAAATAITAAKTTMTEHVVTYTQIIQAAEAAIQAGAEVSADMQPEALKATAQGLISAEASTLDAKLITVGDNLERGGETAPVNATLAADTGTPLAPIPSGTDVVGKEDAWSSPDTSLTENAVGQSGSLGTAGAGGVAPAEESSGDRGSLFRPTSGSDALLVSSASPGETATSSTPAQPTMPAAGMPMMATQAPATPQSPTSTGLGGAASAAGGAASSTGIPGAGGSNPLSSLGGASAGAANSGTLSGPASTAAGPGSAGLGAGTGAAMPSTGLGAAGAGTAGLGSAGAGSAASSGSGATSSPAASTGAGSSAAGNIGRMPPMAALGTLLPTQLTGAETYAQTIAPAAAAAPAPIAPAPAIANSGSGLGPMMGGAPAVPPGGTPGVPNAAGAPMMPPVAPMTPPSTAAAPAPTAAAPLTATPGGAPGSPGAGGLPAFGDRGGPGTPLSAAAAGSGAAAPAMAAGGAVGAGQVVAGVIPPPPENADPSSLRSYVRDLPILEAMAHRALATVRRQFVLAHWAGTALAVGVYRRMSPDGGARILMVFATGDGLSVWPRGVSIPASMTPLSLVDGVDPATASRLSGTTDAAAKLKTLVPAGFGELAALVSTDDQNADQSQEIVTANELLATGFSRESRARVSAERASEALTVTMLKLGVEDLPDYDNARTRLWTKRWDATGSKPTDYDMHLVTYLLADAQRSLSENRTGDAGFVVGEVLSGLAV